MVWLIIKDEKRELGERKAGGMSKQRERESSEIQAGERSRQHERILDER